MTTTMKLHPIFGDCCGDHAGNFDMSLPFVRDGKVYATDARICVRADAPGEPDETRIVPPAHDLDWHNPDTVPVELPHVGDGLVTCGVCCGSGENDYGGECDECDGAGEYGDATGVEVGPVRLARQYIALLRDNGVTHVYPFAHRGKDCKGKPDEKYTAAYFVGDGFDGILMGMQP